MGININSLDEVSSSVYPLHNYEGKNMHLCMLPVTPSCPLPSLAFDSDCTPAWTLRQTGVQDELTQLKTNLTKRQKVIIAAQLLALYKGYKGTAWGGCAERKRKKGQLQQP